jgi:hypothetical protein
MKVQIGDKKMPACTGESCPNRDNCLRFHKIPDHVKYVYFDWPPYNIAKGKCEFQIEPPDSKIPAVDN